jgi:hypothetical protein
LFINCGYLVYNAIPAMTKNLCLVFCAGIQVANLNPPPKKYIYNNNKTTTTTTTTTTNG